MAEEISGAEVAAIVKERGLREYYVRNCSLCNAPLRYVFLDGGLVGFDGACDCTAYRESLRPSSYDAVAEFLNMNPALRAAFKDGSDWAACP